MSKENLVEWRKEYTVLQIISRQLSASAQTDLFLGKLSKRLNVLCQTYGYENVAIVVAHTIRRKKLYFANKYYVWANTVKKISQPEEFNNTSRDFYELTVKCSYVVVCKIADFLMKDEKKVISREYI